MTQNLNKQQLELIKLCLKVTKKEFNDQIKTIGLENSCIIQNYIKEIDDFEPIIQEYIKHTNYKT